MIIARALCSFCAGAMAVLLADNWKITGLWWGSLASKYYSIPFRRRCVWGEGNHFSVFSDLKTFLPIGTPVGLWVHLAHGDHDLSIFVAQHLP
jgi:hypothetical protein